MAADTAQLLLFDTPVSPAATPLLPVTAPSGAETALSHTIVTTPPASLPPGARWREVATAQQVIGFVLKRSRRRSIGFAVGAEGLRVTAPTWATLAQIDAAVHEKSPWILAKLRDWRNRRERLVLTRPDWRAGGTLRYLGQSIRLELGAEHSFFDGNADAPRAGETLWLALPPEASTARVRDAAHGWLQSRARLWFDARLAHFLARSGLRLKRWRLSSATTRWGSCSSDGSIRLNWRLIHFAPAMIDYVIAHELAHLREMHHGPQFWAQVGQILPGFEAARAALRREALENPLTNF